MITPDHYIQKVLGRTNPLLPFDARTTQKKKTLRKGQTQS
jgi:hypothetical protein